MTTGDMTIGDSITDQSCWKSIGIWGDRTCNKLTEAVHCHHCSTYTTVGNQLLHRAAPLNYKAQQTAQIASDQGRGDCSDSLSALIFRLGREWLALPAHLCQQILSPLPFHTLPHRSNRTLLGIVNVHGQLLLKVSLLEILGIDSAHAAAVERPAALKAAKIYPRMVVLEKSIENNSTDTWAFDVDELYGVHPVATSQLGAVAEPAATGRTCTRHVFSWYEQQVSFLDDDGLFDALKRRSL